MLHGGIKAVKWKRRVVAFITLSESCVTPGWRPAHRDERLTKLRGRRWPRLAGTNLDTRYSLFFDRRQIVFVYRRDRHRRRITLYLLLRSFFSQFHFLSSSFLSFIRCLMLFNDSLPVLFSVATYSMKCSLVDCTSFIGKKWMNSWKCSDLKCVRKPTRSRFSVIRHANKSSRWADSKMSMLFVKPLSRFKLRVKIHLKKV